MADFEAIIRKHVGEDGNIPTSAINAIVTAIKSAVGTEFVDKERYKAKLSEIETLKEEKQQAEDNATTASKWKDKYETLKTEHENYKNEVSARETKASKQTAYKGILGEISVPEKWFDRIIKGVNFDEIELDEKGAIKNADTIKEGIKKEWSDVIGKTGQQGADVNNPPENNPTQNVVNPRAAELAKQFWATRYGEVKSE